MNRIFFCCALFLLPASVSLAQGLFGNQGSGNQFGSAFKQSTPTNSMTPFKSDSATTEPNSGSDRFIGRGGNSSGSRPSGSAAPATRSGGGAATSTPQAGSAQPPTSQPSVPRRLSTIRPRHRIAFQFTPSDNESIVTKLAARFSKLSTQHPGLKNVLFDLDDAGLLSLNGQVDSEDTRKLAAILARLEPGVRSIENHITVEGQ